MILRSEYRLEFLNNDTLGLILPLTVSPKACLVTIHELNKDDMRAPATIEGAVDALGLKTHRRYDPLHKKHLEPRIVVPEAAAHYSIFKSFINIYSFITDIPIRIVAMEGKKLIPETAEDEKSLKSLGTALLHSDLSSIPGMRTFALPSLSSETLDELLGKEVGMALYAQALKLPDSMSSFQELWKILESAFGQIDARLVRSLSEYSPAMELGFTPKELENLRILRGRASHASSRSGMTELNDVQRETASMKPRLKCLVEQVLLTKKVWGTKSLEINRLAALSGFIRSDSSTVLFIKKRAMPNSAFS
jgi:hypothetical protein